jgi:L-fuculose-phosphate aldolase
MNDSTIARLREDLCEVGRRVYEKGWVSSRDGNFSIRLGEDRFLVTPTGVSKGFMTPDTMVLVNLEGEPLEGGGKASSEWKLHRKAYEMRSDVGSVVHTHAPHSTAFAVAGLALDRCIFPELIVTLGAVPLAGYGQPGTDDIYQGMLPWIDKANAFLLKNHGLVTFGKDLWEAFNRHDNVEHAARIEILARQIGKVDTLTRDQVASLVKMREVYGVTGVFLDCDCGEEEE